MRIKSKLTIFFAAILILTIGSVAAVVYFSYSLIEKLNTFQGNTVSLVMYWNIFTNKSKNILILDAYSHLNNHFERMLQEWRDSLEDFEQIMEEVDKESSFLNNKELSGSVASVRGVWIYLNSSLSQTEARLVRINNDILPTLDFSGSLLQILSQLNQHVAETGNSRSADYSAEIFQVKERIINLTYADDTFYNLLLRLVKKTEKEVDRVKTAVRIFALCFTMVIFAISFFTALIFSRIFTGRIKQVEKALNAITRGDFSYKLNINTSDEFGILSRNFTLFTSYLRRNINSVNKFMQTTGDAVLENDNIVDFIRQVNHSVKEILRADCVEIQMCPAIAFETGGAGRIIVGNTELVDSIDCEVKKSIQLRIHESGEPIFIKSTNAPEGYFSELWDKGIISLIYTPIFLGNTLYAVMGVYKTKEAALFTDLDFILAKTFSKYTGLAIDNYDKFSILQEKNRLLNEMETARRIQRALLPGETEHDTFDIAAKMITAAEVGGDYYDIITKDGIDWIIIGDVTGHGLSAGLVMMMVQTSIHVILDETPDIDPKELLSIINKTVTRNTNKLGDPRFMTITALCSRDGSRFAYSGLHLPLMIYRQKTASVEIIENEGVWIGIHEEITELNKTDRFVMERGDCLLLYTDGITEARSEKETNKFFGTIQLSEILKEESPGPARKIVDTIIAQLAGYTCNDDITLLVIKKK